MPKTLSVTPGRAGQSVRQYACFDFSGGLDIVTSPVTLANENTNGRRNRLTEATNIVYNVDGSVSKRWGFEQLGPVIGNPTWPEWLGGTNFVKSTGENFLVAAHGTGHLWFIQGTTYTDIYPSFTDRDRRYSFAVYQDTLFIANGADQPVMWTGTGLATTLGGGSPFHVKQFVVHGNRLFATDVQVPSRLYWSKLNNPLDWTGVDDAGFMDVNPNDGGVIKALVPSVQELAILKSYRPYRLQGIGPVTGYTVANSLTPAVGSLGSIGPTSAVFAGNDVWYVSTSGVHRLSATDQFGDLTQGIVSTAIEPFFRQYVDYLPYGVRYTPWRESSYQLQGDPYGDLRNSPMLVHDYANDLLLVGQQGTTTLAAPTTIACDRLLVYDLRLKTWAHWQILDPTWGPQMLTCMFNSTHADFLPEIVVGSRGSIGAPYETNGSLLSLRRGVTSDYSVSINSTLPVTAHVAHISSLDAPGVRKCPRHLSLYFLPVTNSVTITVEIFYDLHTTADVTTSFDLLTALSPESPIIKRVDLGQHLCDTMMVRLSNSGTAENFRWLGYEVLWSARRYIRR
jgi:hypothetical protein